MRESQRIKGTKPLVRKLALIVMLLLTAATMERATVSAQTQLNRAAVVARFADGQNLVKCVTFPEVSITGEELLRRTGWSIVIDAETDQGSAVCKVNDVGCGVDDCFCRCRGGAQCEYWSYWHRVNNEWEYSDTGAGSYSVSDGALEGWSWGPGNWVTGTEPPAFTFQQICNSNTTPPIVRGNTPEPETDQPPDGDFEADELLVEPGECTVLTWVIFDATSVTLDGVQVAAQDRREVCPTASQRYVLIAANAIGQLTREVTIEVLNGGPQLPGQGAPTVAPQQPQPQPQQPAPQQPAPIPNPDMAAPLSTLPPPVEPSPAEMSLVTEAQPAALEVTATPEIRPLYTATPDALELALTALPTPVLIAQAQLDARAGDRATPTPILLALAGDAAGVEIASQAQTAQALDPAALPGYGMFLLMAAGLLGAAAWVWQRSRVH